MWAVTLPAELFSIYYSTSVNDAICTADGRSGLQRKNFLSTREQGLNWARCLEVQSVNDATAVQGICLRSGSVAILRGKEIAHGTRSTGISAAVITNDAVQVILLIERLKRTNRKLRKIDGSITSLCPFE